MNIQNTHDASFEYSHDGTSWVFKIPMTWIFKRHMVLACEYSIAHDVTSCILKIPINFNFLIFKIPMTSAWIFIKLRLTSPHEYSNYFMTSLREYSKDQLIEFSKYSWVTKWRHGNMWPGYFEYSEWHWYILRSCVVLNVNFKIPMTSAAEYFHNVTSLFKIPMTSPHKYSKYP